MLDNQPPVSYHSRHVGFSVWRTLCKDHSTLFFSKTGTSQEKKYLDLSSAVTAANSLAKDKDRDAYIIEYTDKPVVFCLCHPDGRMEQIK